MIEAAIAAAEQIFTAPFRAVFWKSIGLTILLLGLLWTLFEHLVVAYVRVPYAWLATSIQVVAGLGLVVGIVFLVPPVSFVVASFFFDELAAHTEATIVGSGGRGCPMAFVPAAWIGLKFAGVSLVVFAVALVLLLIPGFNLVAFFGANAYLFGRGFFELAALRYVDITAARELRRRHSLRIFVAGCVVAALAAIPIVNFLTPLFAVAFMVRVAQPLLRRVSPHSVV